MAEAECFVAAVEAAAPFDLTVRPWRVGIAPEFTREPGLLPLWLEPDIDYQARVIRLDPSEYKDGVPHPSVLLHEVMHLVQTDVLYPHHQTIWLTEAVCDYFAASWIGSPRLFLLSEQQYPALSRTLDHHRHYPEDVATQVDWIEQQVSPLAASDLADRHPDVLAQVRAVAAEASHTELAPHSVGNLLGGAFWEAQTAIGRTPVWSSVLAAVHDHPQPASLTGWLTSWLAAMEHHAGRDAQATTAEILNRRGFPS